MKVRINSIGRVKDDQGISNSRKFLCGKPLETGEIPFPPFAEGVRETNGGSTVIWLPKEAVDADTGETFDLVQMVIDGLAEAKACGAHLYLTGELFGIAQDDPFEKNGVVWQTNTIQLVKGAVPEFEFEMPVPSTWKRGIKPLAVAV